MLGKYETKTTLPKSKFELVKSISNLGQVDILVFDMVDGKVVGKVKGELDRFIGSGKKNVSVVFIKEI